MPQQTIDEITAIRSNEYGDPEEQHACTHALWEVLQFFWARNNRHADVSGNGGAKTCLQNVIQKVARLVCGNVKHLDSWQDIQGYADNGMRCLKVGDYAPRACILDPDRDADYGGVLLFSVPPKDDGLYEWFLAKMAEENAKDVQEDEEDGEFNDRLEHFYDEGGAYWDDDEDEDEDDCDEDDEDFWAEEAGYGNR